MYLRGSQWSMTRRRRRPSNPWVILFLLGLISAALYFNQVIAPTIPNLIYPTPTPTRSAESYVSEAQEYFRQGKLASAIAAYQEAILSNPANPATYLALAQVQVFAGAYEEALKNAENALILNSNNANAHAVKAWALDFLRDYLSAETAAREALKLDPNNALAYAYLSEILIDTGDPGNVQAAIDASHKALDLSPDTLEAHRARGYVLMSTGNYAEAIEEYKAAIAIHDRLADLHLSLGVLYRATEEYELALQEMITASSLSPNSADIQTEISRTYAAVGQFGKAVQAAEQAVKIDPSNPRLHGNLGVMLYREKNDYRRAVAELELAVRGGVTADGVAVNGLPLAPGRVADDYYSIYGLALTQQDRCAEAVPVFQLIIQNIEDDQTAYYNAQEGILYCQEAAANPQPEATETTAP